MQQGNHKLLKNGSKIFATSEQQKRIDLKGLVKLVFWRGRFRWRKGLYAASFDKTRAPICPSGIRCVDQCCEGASSEDRTAAANSAGRNGFCNSAVFPTAFSIAEVSE
jgi:hypothetical protein